MMPMQSVAEKRRGLENALACVLAASVLCGWGAMAELIYWDFNTLEPTSNRAPHVTAGSVTRANGGLAALLSGLSCSGDYEAASGLTNLQAVAHMGSLSTKDSTYFEVTLTPLEGYRLSVTNLSFGTRSTGTGPCAYSVRADTDQYASALADGAIATNSVWTLKAHALSLRPATAGQSVTMRIYGYGGTSSGSYNWRIDDLRIDVETAVAAMKPLGVVLLK